MVWEIELFSKKKKKSFSRVYIDTTLRTYSHVKDYRSSNFWNVPWLSAICILLENQFQDSVRYDPNKEISFHQFETPLKPNARPPRRSHWNSMHGSNGIFPLRLSLVINLQHHFSIRDKLTNLRESSATQPFFTFKLTNIRQLNPRYFYRPFRPSP